MMARMILAALTLSFLAGCAQGPRQLRYVEHSSYHSVQQRHGPAWTSPAPGMPFAPDWQMTGHRTWMSGPVAPDMSRREWSEYYATGELPFRAPSTHTRGPKFWHHKCNDNGCWMVRG